MGDSHIATYNLQVFSPKPEEDAPSLSDTDKRVLADLPAMLEAVEIEFARFLPEGYRVEITEWSEKRPTGHLIFGDAE